MDVLVNTDKEPETHRKQLKLQLKLRNSVRIQSEELVIESAIEQLWATLENAQEIL